MTAVTHNTESQPRQPSTLRRAAGELTAGFALMLAVAVATRWLFNLPNIYLLQSVTVYILMAVLFLRAIPDELCTRGLGAANRVTLGRAALLIPVAALALQANGLTHNEYWWVISASIIVMILDGVDGWIARRTKSSTTFGARFDMELDAFLMMALSVLVWRSGKLGPWVLLIGALRYLFVASSWCRPALKGDLPASQVRKAICVVQGVLLLVCLGPIIPVPLASIAAASALVLLVYSFTVDIRWLVSKER